MDIPLFLKHLTDDLKTVQVQGQTVGECLHDFVERFPLTREFLFNRDGGLLGHIDVYVNGLSSFPEELAKKVQSGDRVSILFLIEGG